jgi:hypothetical protein
MENHTVFNPISLSNDEILAISLINFELNKDDSLGLVGKDNYIIDFIFSNVLKKDEFNQEMEEYFDKIYEVVLKNTGIYLENIEILDSDELYAWGQIYKDGDTYYTYKPPSIE